MTTEPIAELVARSGIRGEVIWPSNEGYDARRRVWNGLFDRRPALIVRPVDADDVRRVVDVAADAALSLAIRCGGHSFPGHSTCDGGIVIDLSMMNEVTVDKDRSRVSVGGGALLRDVDAAGEPHGLLVPAGVVSHTGAGGLTLGGGMGWNSRRYGLTIDNLQSVDLVCADGSLLTVDDRTEPDLFWAVRGGGGNFGVVTNFEFRMRPLGSAAAVTSIFPADHAGRVLTSYAELVDGAPRELASSFSISRDDLRIKTMWCGSRDVAASILGPFQQLGGVTPNQTYTSTFWELQQSSDEAVPWGRRYYAKGGFLSGVDSAVIDWLTQCLAQSPTPESDVYVIQLGGAVADVSDDATAYTGRNAAFYWVVNGVWDSPDQDESCIDWGRLTAEGLTARSLAGNYINEQSDASPEVARKAYGSTTYERLVSLKRRYDPTNLFHLNQNIRPQIGTTRTTTADTSSAMPSATWPR